MKYCFLSIIIVTNFSVNLFGEISFNTYYEQPIVFSNHLISTYSPLWVGKIGLITEVCAYRQRSDIDYYFAVDKLNSVCL